MGKSIIENIADAIDTSQKVVLVLSGYYTQSQWCMFEAHMAQHRLVQENRQSLIVIRLEQLEVRGNPVMLETYQALSRIDTRGGLTNSPTRKH